MLAALAKYPTRTEMSYLANRNVTLYTASTIKTNGLGNFAAIPSANQSAGTFSNWITAKSSLQNLKKIAVSSTGQYEVAVTAGALWYSSDSGVTWMQPAARGLPTSVTYACGSVSADGLYITIGVTGDYLYMSQDRGATFNNPAPTATPYAWLPLQGNTTDIYGNVITVSASIPGYASKGPIPSLQNAINLVNATAGGTATQYLKGAWTGSAAWTVSFWFNSQSASANQNIFAAYGGGVAVYISPSNLLNIYTPSGQAFTSTFAVSTNTWYFVSASFQANGTGYLYVNNTLVGSYVNSGGYGALTTTQFSLGGSDTNASQAFNGYIADFRLYNSAIAYQNIPVLAPYAWLKFDNSTTDAMGAATITPSGTIAYVPSMIGSSAVNLVNNAGSTASSYIRGTMPTTSSFTVSLWFNPQTVPTTATYQTMFSAFSTNWSMYMKPNYVSFLYGSDLLSSPILALGKWYNLVATFVANGTGSFYMNNTLIGTYSCGATAGTSSGLWAIGTNDTNINYSFNGFIDDLRIYPFVVSPSQIYARNWSSLSVSGSGQYQLAGADDGAVFSSSNYGASWALQPAASSAGSIRTLSL